jgi:hypothetical protein
MKWKIISVTIRPGVELDAHIMYTHPEKQYRYMSMTFKDSQIAEDEDLWDIVTALQGLVNERLPTVTFPMETEG